MRHWMPPCVTIMIVLMAAASFAQDKDTPKDDRITITPKYIRVEPTELADHADKFVGRSIEIHDRYHRIARLSDIPSAVTKLGLHPRAYEAFVTHAVRGSNMLCFIARADKESLAVLDGLVDESPITLAGEVLARLNGKTIFKIGRIFRGHMEVPEIEKRRLVVTFQLPQGGKPVQYTIPVLDKFYNLSVPLPDGKTVKVHFKAELR